MRDDRAAIGAVAVLATTVLIACSPANPSTGPTGPSAPTGTPAGPTPTPQTTTPASLDPTAIEIHVLGPEFRHFAGLVSTGSEVLWSSGSEIWRLVPDGAPPERVFASESHEAEVIGVAGSSRGYAFTERNADGVAGAWRLWWLPRGATSPTLIDRGTAEGAGPPTLALDERRLAWAGFDEPGGEPMTFLRVADLESPADERELLSMPIADGLLWYPVLDGDSLWYAIIHADFAGTGVGDEFHIETIELNAASVTPTRFPGTANDFDPAVSPDYVAWKTVAPQVAARSWGELRVIDRRTQGTIVLPISRVKNPSLGDRFLAFDEIFRNRLLLFDLATRELVEVPAPVEEDALFSNASLAGDLWTFVVGVENPSADKDLIRIAWSLLPD